VASIAVTEAGPLRASVRVERAWRDSRIVQSYRLWAGSARLDIETEIDWHERAMLLRARFPLAVHTHEATFETMYGVVRRPTHRNTSWDAARFEVSGHRFVDLSEPGYGVALLNDGKYGHSAHGNVLGLSLVRGPLYPDPFADEGHHHFTYSLFPHPGDWTEAGVTAEAFVLNSPLVVAGSSNKIGGSYGFVTVEGTKLALGALKPAEDGNGVILRVYEPHGARGVATLRFADMPGSVTVVNLLEDEADSPQIERMDERSWRFPVDPFQIVSLRTTWP
jgi:alpha-mannosidase